MNKHKNTPPSDREDAEARLLQGLAIALAALPELIWRWLTDSED